MKTVLSTQNALEFHDRMVEAEEKLKKAKAHRDKVIAASGTLSEAWSAKYRELAKDVEHSVTYKDEKGVWRYRSMRERWNGFMGGLEKEARESPYTTVEEMMAAIEAEKEEKETKSDEKGHKRRTVPEDTEQPASADTGDIFDERDGEPQRGDFGIPDFLDNPPSLYDGDGANTP